jgi:hypothetical protein
VARISSQISGSELERTINWYGCGPISQLIMRLFQLLFGPSGRRLAL